MFFFCRVPCNHSIFARRGFLYESIVRNPWCICRPRSWDIGHMTCMGRMFLHTRGTLSSHMDRRISLFFETIQHCSLSIHLCSGSFMSGFLFGGRVIKNILGVILTLYKWGINMFWSHCRLSVHSVEETLILVYFHPCDCYRIQALYIPLITLLTEHKYLKKAILLMCACCI